MGRRADGGGTALYLKRIHSPFLILVYQRIGSVAAPNSTKKNGRNPYRLSRVRPRGVLRQPVCPPRAPHWARLPRHLAGGFFLSSQEYRGEWVNSSFRYPPDTRFIQTRYRKARRPRPPPMRGSGCSSSPTAFLFFYRGGSFFSLLAKHEEMANSIIPSTIATPFTQTHSPQ